MKKIRANPQYDAGFTRAVDPDAVPEDPGRRQARRARWRKLVLGLAGLTVCGAVAGGYAVLTRDTPADQRERGKRLSAAGDHEGAIAEFKRSLLGEPAQPALRFLLGEEYSAVGDSKDAAIEYRKAYELRYEPDRTLPLVVAAMLAQEQFKQVIATVNGARISSPAANADLQAYLGTAYFALGREAEARTAWRAARRLVPMHQGASMAEAGILIANGAYDEADALLAPIMRDAPRQRELSALRAEVARGTGRSDEAVALYDAAIKADPTNLSLQTRLAQVEIDLHRYDDARRQLDAVFNIAPNDSQGLYTNARLLAASGDYTGASDSVTQSILQSPRDGKAHLLAGTIALERNRPDEAELHLREAVALMPKDPAARRALVELYIRQREPGRADEVLAPLLAAAPDDKQFAALGARIAALRGDRAPPAFTATRR